MANINDNDMHPLEVHDVVGLVLSKMQPDARTLISMRRVCRVWRDVVDTHDVLWLEAARHVWPETVLLTLGSKSADLHREKTTDRHKRFQGFGYGAHYEQSDEGKKRQQLIEALEKNEKALAARITKILEDGGPASEMPVPEGQPSWGAFVRGQYAAQLQCHQCGKEYREKDNDEKACIYHSRGGGTTFSWDEDDFIHVENTCCDDGHPEGCKTGRHNCEDGVRAPKNANRDWSTAHM